MFINNQNCNNTLSLIPKENDDFSKIKIKNLSKPDIVNEYAYHCGFFGWCYICRKESNHYSVDIRVPICTFACKNVLLNEEQQLLRIRNNLIKDCPEMVKFFCQMLSNKASTNMQKIFALEIITNILQNYGNKYKIISHNFAKYL